MPPPEANGPNLGSPACRATLPQMIVVPAGILKMEVRSAELELGNARLRRALPGRTYGFGENQGEPASVASPPGLR
jgi:hypothetical protein